MKDSSVSVFSVKHNHSFWTASPQMMKVQNSFLDYDVFSTRLIVTED